MKIWSLFAGYPGKLLCRPRTVRCAVQTLAALCLSALTLAAQTPSATPAPSQAHPGRQLLRGHVPAAVAGLTPVASLAGSNRLNLAIGLPLRNQEALAARLKQIYNPASPDYRKFLTPEQFAEMFGPTEQDYQAVIAFAKANGLTVTGTHPNRTLLDVGGSVADIEKVFHVNMRVYQHPKEARTFYAPDVEPSIDLAVPVLNVSGFEDYVVPHPLLKLTPLNQATNVTPMAGSGPIGLYMGNDFRAAYAPGVLLRGTGQSVGLLQFDGYYPSDISTYENFAGLPHVPLQNVYLNGFTGTPGLNNSEVALDIDMAISMAPGLSNVIVYQSPNIGGASIANDMLNRMATDNKARQLSSSWSFGINAATEQIFQQYAVQGQSFFQASGDSGAWASDFIPSPCDDPYVTVVGGTTLQTTGPGGAWSSEIVWNAGFFAASGGGISPNYPIPSYQDGVDMSANAGSTSQRNIPDVALTADNIFIIADNGYGYIVSGTSAATPLWAGFTALINQQAAINGNSPVGFVNPALYQIGLGSSYSATFHDILDGDNTGVYDPNNFFAASGYDLCTGWGTPTGLNMIRALAGQPARTGFLGMSVDPQPGSTLISSTDQPIYVTVSDVYDVTNATVTATITGFEELSLLNDGEAPDDFADDAVYSSSFGVPDSISSLTVTVVATAPGEVGVTNTFNYNVISLPANDDFANATKVPAAGAVYVSNNRFATMEELEPQHAGDTNVAASLWWSWTPTSNTNVLIDTAGSTSGRVLAVYTGSTLTTLSQVGAISTSDTAFLRFNATVGTKYHIVVASVNPYTVGSLRLRVVPGGQLDTNRPVVFVATPPSGLWVSNNIVTVSGTANDPQPNASGVRQVFVIVNDLVPLGAYPVTATGTTNWSSVAGLRKGLNTIRVIAQDVAGNVSAQASVQVTYVVPDPPNDLFANAIALEGDSGTVGVSTTNATKELGEPNHADNSGGKSVWWSFQPSEDGNLTLDTSGSSYDTVLALYQGPDVSHLTLLAANDDATDGAPGGFSEISQAVKAGQIYHIAVDGYDGAFGVASLSYSFEPASVYRLTVGSTAGGNVETTTANPDGGIQVMPSSSGDFAGGSTVTLAANANADYQFDHWEGDVEEGASFNNPLTLEVNSDLNLTAHFRLVAFTDGFESGSLTNLNWTTGGNKPWVVQTNVASAGLFAARSGAIGDSQTSSLILTRDFVAGDGSFDYKVSSEANFDWLQFYVNGILLQQWSGEAGWANYTFPLAAGTNTLEWRYAKDASLKAGLDAAFVDNINLPIVDLELRRLPQGTFLVDLSSPTNHQFVVQASTNLVEWEGIATNAGTSSFMHILDPASRTNSMRFYRVISR